MKKLEFKIVVENPRAIEFLLETVKRLLIERVIVNLEISEVTGED